MTAITLGQHINILVVEDNPEDYETTRRAFDKAGMKDSIRRCKDGDEALDYLYRRGPYEDAESSPRPGIILLDLNLPGTDGRQVLAQIKAEETLRDIPVIVLTTSTDERDIEDCYHRGANSYMQKPVDLSGFMGAVQRLTDYWIGVVVLPLHKTG